MTEGDDLRAFIRDIMARFDRGMDAVLRQQEIQREESRRYFEQIEARQRRDHEEARVKLDEILAEGRAGRAALFAILDRLDNGGSAPAAG
jgi:hypothetical protein